MRGSLRVALACALLLAVVPATALTQVNIESMRQQADRDGFAFQGSLDLSTRSGNVDDTSLGISVDTRYRGSLRSILLAFRGDYGWQGGEQFSNEGLAHLRYTHGFNPVFALEAFLQSDYNKARLLDTRALAGAGVRLTLVDGEHGGLAVGSSCMVEHEELDLPPEAGHPAETDVTRWSSYVGLRWTISEAAGLSITGYTQPQIDDFEDVRVIASGGFQTRITGTLSLQVSYRLRHDSRPPDSIESTDTRLTTGVAIAF